MKKKLALLFVCVMSFTLFLGGCNLFPLDTVKYLNQKVATIEYVIGDETKTLTITKEDLINAYRTNEETLSQYGISGEEAYDQVVNMLINKEIILDETEKLIEKGTIVVSNENLNDMWQTTYEALLKNIGTFEEEVIKAWKLNIPAELGDKKESSIVSYAPYKPTAEVVQVETADGVEYKIKTIDEENSNPNEALTYEKGKEISTLYEAVYERIGNSTVLNEAQKRYISQLKENEEGKKLSTDNKSVFEREIERVYNSVKENKYLDLYDKVFENQSGYSMVSVSQVLSYITANMISSYTKYSIDFSAYENDILNDRENMWYVMDEEYFYVTHILVKFSEEQSEDIKNLETLYKKGAISYQDYKSAKDLIAHNAVVKDLSNEGEETSLTVEDLKNNLINELSGKDNAEKAEIIRNYVYKYSEDDGNKNKNYEYIIGTEKSSMVDEFNAVARDLYDNGNGKFGDVGEEFAVSEYGVHILCYLEPVKNAFTITNVNTFDLNTANTDELAENINIITSQKLSPFYDRTIFSFAYDKLYADNFSKFEALNTEVLRKDKEIKIYHKNYEDLWNI